MFKRANDNFESARKKMVDVPDSVPETGKPYFFKGPGFEDDETIALCIETIIGWAVALEAFVNLTWASHPKTKDINERSSGNTIAKLKKLYKAEGFAYGDLVWRCSICDLFEMRNYLVHYKEKIDYVGFNFAAKFQHDLSERNMQKIQEGVVCALKDMSVVFNVDAGFVDGNYDHLVYRY